MTIIILSFFIKACKAEEWEYWSSITNDNNSYKIIEFVDSHNLDLQFRVDGEVVENLKSKKIYHSNEFFLIPPNKTATNYEVYKLQNHKKSKINYSQKLITSEKEMLFYNNFYNIYLELDKVSKKEILNRLRTLFLKYPQYKMNYSELSNIYAWSLYELEEYHQLLEFLKVQTNSFSIKNNHLQRNYYWLMGLAYLNESKLNKAGENFLEALDVVNYNPSDINSLYQQELLALIGFANCLSAFYNHQNMTGCIKEIAQSYKILKNSNEDLLLSKVLYLLASAYTLNGEYEISNVTIKLAIKNLKSANYSSGLYLMYNQIAINHLFQNDYVAALENYRNVLKNLDTDIHQFSKAGIYHNLSRTYIALGDFKRAYRYLSLSLSIFKEIKSNNEVVKTLNTMGDINRSFKKFKLSVNQHKKSLEHYKNQNVKLFLDSILDLSKDYFAMSEYQLSRNEIYKLIITSNAKFNYSSLSVLTNTQLESILHDELVNFKVDSLVKFEAILILAELTFKNNDIKELKKYDVMLAESDVIENLNIEVSLRFFKFEINTIYILSKIDSLEALNLKTINYISKIRSKINISDLALHWTNQAKSVVTKLVDVLELQNDFDSIFILLEKYYAINLREKRQNTNNNLIKQKSDEFQQALDSYINLERQTLLSNDLKTQNQADEAKELFLAKDEKSEQPVGKIELEYLPIEQVQEKLADDELFLRYYISDNNSFVYVIDKNYYEIKKLSDSSKLNEIVKGAINSVKSKRFSNLINESSIYEQILPHKKILDNSYKKIIIIPDGIVNLMPFSSINVSQNKGEYLPLATQVEIERTFSASDYFSKQSIAKNDDTISVFANPIFLKNTDNQSLKNKFTKSNKLWEFEPLPYTNKEAEDIVKIFPESSINVLSGAQATNENFLSKNNRNANIIHIATHGFFNDESLENVGIATSVVGADNKQAPGILAMREILYQPFKANLAVVSGCETTLGKEISGEGFNSLSRGLLSQGVNSVIGTIWSISDRATPLFMKEFYTNLKNMGGDVSKALNQAKKNFATLGKYRRYRHPYYWAGFVLTSSNRGISGNTFGK